MSDWEPKITTFLCHWCSYGAADLAGVSRLQYPHNPLFRQGESEVHPGRIPQGSGRDMGFRVTPRRLPLPGR